MTSHEVQEASRQPSTLHPPKLPGEPELLAGALHDVCQLLAAAPRELPESPLLPAAFAEVSATPCCEVPELLRATHCEGATLCELPGWLRMELLKTMSDSVMTSRKARWLARAVSEAKLPARAVSAMSRLLPVDINTSGFALL